MSTPNQAQSHKIRGEFLYLDFALKATIHSELSITDSLMIQLLPMFDDKSIRRIRRKFMKQGLIKQVGKRLPNKSIEYNFTDLVKANQVRQNLENSFMEKQEPKILQIPNSTLLEGFTNLSNHYIISYELKDRKIPPQLYPKIFYRDQRRCPLCGQERLRKLKNSSYHELDRRCFNCKIYFQFHKNGIIAKN